MARAEAREPPFGRHDYALVFGWRERTPHMTISGRLAAAPTIGDIYTLGQPGGGVDDMVVVQITRDADGWSALCELSDETQP